MRSPFTKHLHAQFLNPINCIGMTRILAIIFVCCSVICYGQGELNYTFTLSNDQGAPMPGVAVNFKNNATGSVTTLTTDRSGMVKITLKSEDGLSYGLSFLDHENEVTLTVPENGIRTASKKLTYKSMGDVAAAEPAERDGVVFREVSLGPDGSTSVTISLTDDINMPVSNNVNVVLSDVANGLKYKPVKAVNGKYVFYVKPGTSYELDVNGVNCLTKITTSATASQLSKSISYVVSDVKETVKGDTIFQTNAATANKSTDRMKYTVKITAYSGSPLVGEPIYLKAIDGKAVYAGTTDEQGAIVFQLPKTTDFVVNLKYESNLRTVNCRRMKNGFSEGSLSFGNRGYRAIEEERRKEAEERKQAAIRAIELAKEQASQAKIDEQLRKDAEKKLKARQATYNPADFKTDFANTPIKPYPSSSIKVQKTINGFTVDAGSHSSVGTPLLAGTNVISTGGFYSSILYSFNPSSGSINWSVQLSEGGPSALVYQDGVVLVYTESCTLYAIDAIAGNLLWSKYLTSYVYSSPSVANGKVVAVYKDYLGHVAICMDLKTGKIVWQKPMESECLGAPVMAGGKVHITSVGGFLHIFDLASGNNVKQLNINAKSSPTIATDALYVTHAAADGKEKIGKYAIPGYTFVKAMDVLEANSALMHEPFQCEQNMNYNGSRILGYKGLSYFLTAGKLKCLDPGTEKIVWSQDLLKANSQGLMQPLALENTIAIGDLSGMVRFFDYKNGNKLMEYNVGEPLNSAPMIANNTIYAGSTRGKLIVHKMDKPVKSLGTMWGGNAAHNLWITQ